MAKQTFTTGQVLTAAQMTSLQQTAMLGGDASAKVASYVLVAADAGTAISMSNGSATTITVNTGLFAAGDIVTIINLGAGVCTITAGTATVTTSGSLALAQNQGGVLRFTSASAAIFFQFATPASGDIEGVTAGTGISGGGTSGTVTITNSMATEIDAKGDLIVGTGADTFARLAVGTNGHTLVADSAETTGLKWAAASSGALTKIAAASFATESSVAVDNVFTSTYTRYMALLRVQGSSSGPDLEIQYRYAGPTTQTTDYYGSGFSQDRANAQVNFGYVNGSVAILGDNLQVVPSAVTIFFDKVGNSSQNPIHWGNGYQEYLQGLVSFAGYQDTQRIYTGFLIKPSSGTITGSYVVYGLEK